jgi:hypothetical protein
VEEVRGVDKSSLTRVAVTCFYCGKLGHMKKDRKKRQRDEEQKKSGQRKF